MLPDHPGLQTRHVKTNDAEAFGPRWVSQPALSSIPRGVLLPLPIISRKSRYTIPRYEQYDVERGVHLEPRL